MIQRHLNWEYGKKKGTEKPTPPRGGGQKNPLPGPDGIIPEVANFHSKAGDKGDSPF